MRSKDFDKLGLNPAIIANFEFPVMTLVLGDEFSKLQGDYRDNAVKRCVKARVGFQSEVNSVRHLMTKYVSVKCPLCRRKMKSTDGGGNCDNQTVTYRCGCGTSFDIKLTNEAITVGFPPPIT